ncbi:uncharacterized protein PG986_004379 [Apiospora aurea]|uniref:Uncharacterized protein n=1 Tax=Apiospora aurea TaxID=335848 RepID=A0ABR1QMF1_9PEZI
MPRGSTKNAPNQTALDAVSSQPPAQSAQSMQGYHRTDKVLRNINGQRLAPRIRPPQTFQGNTAALANHGAAMREQKLVVTIICDGCVSSCSPADLPTPPGVYRNILLRTIAVGFVYFHLDLVRGDVG